MVSSSVFLQGLGMGASLIMPIGAQNAHVIRTAVGGRHVRLTVAVCVIVDALLIALGASGVGLLVESSPRLLSAARYGGGAFLLWYGVRCLASARRGGQAPPDDGAPATGSPAASSARRALFAVLALSLLNPHVYLDTVVLLGAVGRHGRVRTRSGDPSSCSSAVIRCDTADGVTRNRAAAPSRLPLSTAARKASARPGSMDMS